MLIQALLKMMIVYKSTYVFVEGFECLKIYIIIVLLEWKLLKFLNDRIDINVRRSDFIFDMGKLINQLVKIINNFAFQHIIVLFYRCNSFGYFIIEYIIKFLEFIVDWLQLIRHIVNKLLFKLINVDISERSHEKHANNHN